MSKALESAHCKIVRTLQERQAIEDLYATYRANKPVEIVTDSNGKENLRIHRLPPIEISLLAGEILYHCRSALDHLFFELVERTHGGSLPKALAKISQFPLTRECPTGYSPPVPKNILLPKEQLFNWVPDVAYTFIEGLQPYNRWNDGRGLLRMLTVFSNIDKHRRLATTVLRAHTREIATNDLGTSMIIGLPLHDGAEITPLRHDLPAQGEMNVVRDVYFKIAFDEPEFGPPQTAPLDDLTHNLPLVVFNIVQQFQNFLS